MSDEDQKPKPDKEDVKEKKDVEQISIKVTSGDGNEIFFKVKKHTKLEKVMQAFCDRLGRSLKDVRFMYDGANVSPTDTPESLDLEDGDGIEAMITQIGGRA